MAAVLLLNRSITQAGAHYTSRLIHPAAEQGNDPQIIIDFSMLLLAADSTRQNPEATGTNWIVFL